MPMLIANYEQRSCWWWCMSMWAGVGAIWQKPSARTSAFWFASQVNTPLHPLPTRTPCRFACGVIVVNYAQNPSRIEVLLHSEEPTVGRSIAGNSMEAHSMNIRGPRRPWPPRDAQLAWEDTATCTQTQATHGICIFYQVARNFALTIITFTCTTQRKRRVQDVTHINYNSIDYVRRVLIKKTNPHYKIRARPSRVR